MVKEKGSILIFTLWVLVILSILSIILSHRASTDITLGRYEANKIKGSYLVRAGVFKMLSELIQEQDTNTWDSLNEDWNRGMENPKILTIRNDEVLYGASDESARFNLNGSNLEKEHLIRLGIENDIAGNIFDYIAKKDEKKFEFMEELFLIEGMTKEVYSEIKDLVTIYRGDEYRVNINTASEQVLKVVTGKDSLVQDILDYRMGDDGEEGTEDDRIFETNKDIQNKAITEMIGLNPELFDPGSNIFRIWARYFISEDKEKYITVEAVVDRPKGKIYHWKEF